MNLYFLNHKITSHAKRDKYWDATTKVASHEIRSLVIDKVFTNMNLKILRVKYKIEDTYEAAIFNRVWDQL